MFFTQYAVTPADLSALPSGQRELFQSLSAWLWVVYGIATDTGSLASILLLLRHRLAVPLFWISLLAVVVQFGYSLFPGHAIKVLGAAQALPMPVLIVAVAAALVWFARRARVRGWIGGDPVRV